MTASICLLVSLSLSITAWARTPQELKAAAQTILTTSCLKCHGPKDDESGGLVGNILNTKELIAGDVIKPGNPNASTLIQKIQSDAMPKGNTKLTAEQKQILVDWVTSLAAAPAAVPNAPSPIVQTPSKGKTKDLPPLLGDEEILGVIKNDLSIMPQSERKFFRYFRLNPRSGDGLQSQRDALSIVLNSLSQNRNISRPDEVSTAEDNSSLVRIDLRKYGWDSGTWFNVQNANPFATHFPTTGATREFFEQTLGVNAQGNQDIPVARADWFVATASKPPLYYNLQRTPDSAAQLEASLGINAAQDVADNNVARAGFRHSGVSVNNRLIERHDTKVGAYWKSLDYADSQGQHNIFAHPLDSAPNGGEIIYSLPNGLQAYMLIDANGNRLDKAVTTIVSDVKRPDRAVENGVSCMSCHVHGLLNNTDEIAQYVRANPGLFSQDDLDKIKLIHKDPDVLKGLVSQDTALHNKAFALAAGPSAAADPVGKVIHSFEADISVDRAASELGFDTADFLAFVERNADAIRDFGGLKANCSMPRDTFLADLPAIAPFVDQVERASISDDVKKRALQSMRWSTNGRVNGLACMPIFNPGNHDAWKNNFLCSDKDYRFQWSNHGRIKGMYCVQFNEPKSPNGSWNNSWLCTPDDFGLYFLNAGTSANQNCIQITAPGEGPEWSDNFLCSTAGPLGK